MDSRQLSYYRSVVDHGSFTQAAETLDMTQPSLSLSIRKLEKELDVQLLSRGRAGVSTTEAGEYLYKVAVKMESLLSEAEQRIREIAGGLAGTISINAAPEFNWAFMPGVISRMHAAAPDVSIMLQDPEPLTTLEQVLDGSVDLGLMPSTDPHAFAQRYQDKLVVHVAAEWPFKLALPPRLSYLPDPVSLAEVAEELWVLPPRSAEFIGLPEVLDQLWGRFPETMPSRVQHIATLQTAVPLVAGGVGVSLLPDFAAQYLKGVVHFRSIQEQLPPMQAVLIYPKDKELSPAANHLVDIILEVGTENDYQY